MILNERQRQITEKWRRRFSADHDAFTGVGLDPVMARACKSALATQRDEHAAEIARYDGLKAGLYNALPVDATDEPFAQQVGLALIQARIARGWRQKDLARWLGLPEQSVQRDEADGYMCASLSRLVRVAEVLGLRLSVSGVLVALGTGPDGAPMRQDGGSCMAPYEPENGSEEAVKVIKGVGR